MTNDSRHQAIVQLLHQTGRAHHAAFITVDGADPEWPLWYAAYLQGPLGELLGYELSQSEIVYWLVRLDREYSETGSQEPWPQWYARMLLDEYE